MAAPELFSPCCCCCCWITKEIKESLRQLLFLSPAPTPSSSFGMYFFWQRQFNLRKARKNWQHFLPVKWYTFSFECRRGNFSVSLCCVLWRAPTVHFSLFPLSLSHLIDTKRTPARRNYYYSYLSWKVAAAAVSIVDFQSINKVVTTGGESLLVMIIKKPV